jgi:xylose dehydrogenase (NAD/NADP)
MQLDAYFDGVTERDWQTVDDTVDPVRFAVVGTGWWTRKGALPALAESDFCEPAVVVDRDADSRETAAGDHDAVALDPDAFVDGDATDRYDAVYVATPNNTHREYTNAAARLGKHVVCEKPMEVSSGRARDMVDTCEERGVTLMIAYRMQLAPVARRTRELLAAGFVGEVQSVHSHVSDRLLDVNPDPDQWKLQPEIAGGCAAIQIGVYPLNTTRFVLDADPVAVQATTGWTREAFEGVDEYAAFQLEFPDGVVALCSASHDAYVSSHLKITGMEGEITIEPAFVPWRDRELVLERHDTRTHVTFDQVDQMVEEFDYFADCVRSGRTPGPDGRNGLRDVEIVESIYEAAESGRRVSL